jgi:hypothetical protein
MVEILFAFGERGDDPWRDARADECTLTPDPRSETEELDDDRIPRPVELVDRGTTSIADATCALTWATGSSTSDISAIVSRRQSA